MRCAKRQDKKFFSLPASSVSRFVVAPMAKIKRDEFLASNLKADDIVAAPWRYVDESDTEEFFLGEVVETEKLSMTFFSDRKPFDYLWNDKEMTNILKGNDINAGDCFRACSAHAVGRRLFFRNATDDPKKKYLSIRIYSWLRLATQQHHLQLCPDQSGSPPSSASNPQKVPISAGLSRPI